MRGEEQYATSFRIMVNTHAFRIRAATVDDVNFLWRMLSFAASMGGTSEDILEAQSNPSLKDYVQGYGRTGDLGVVATLDDQPIGAAWLRLAPSMPASSSKVWTLDTPELSIAVEPEFRGQGVGARMLEALIERARGVYLCIALTVRESNPARVLYERVGFTLDKTIVNRVGTISWVMRISLGAPEPPRSLFSSKPPKTTLD